MSLSISNIAWNPNLDDSIAELLNKHDVHCIDIAPGKYFNNLMEVETSEILSVKHFWDMRRISIIGMQSLFYGTKGFNVFGETYADMLSYLGIICKTASILGARFLTFGSPKNRDRSRLSDSETLDRALSFFYKAGKIAQNHNVVLCLEPNPKEYGANFLTTTNETYNFIKMLNHPNIKLQLDVGALILNDETIKDIDMSSDMIGHIHISEPQLRPVGTNQAEHSLFSLTIKKLESNKTIEMLTTDAGNPLEVIEKSLIFAKRLYA